MSRTLKLIGEERSLSSANNVGSATLVRVYNDTAGAVLITRSTSGAVTLGTTTIAANTVEFFVKDSSDTLTANAAVLATPVAFTN